MAVKIYNNNDIIRSCDYKIPYFKLGCFIKKSILQNLIFRDPLKPVIHVDYRKC